MNKISIRFLNDRYVRVVWDDENSKWWFSVPDVIGVLNNEADHAKNRNYWKFLKGRLRRENSELVSVTNQLKLAAADGKQYSTDVLDSAGIMLLAQNMPNSKSARFIEWFAAPGESIDGRSQVKACALFESGITESIEAGTVKGLRQIHAWLFGGLYDFAGQIRTKNIAKGGFQFAMARYLPQTLRKIESMPDGIFDEIVTKYVEMNVAHPFMEGNGRSARIWLDLILKKRLGKCVDWSKISKNDYLNAMKKSVADESAIRSLLQGALTDKINDRETFMKGIERSYQYEDAE